MERIQTLTISEVARRANLTPKAIRLYESRGLLPEVNRTASVYRVFGDRDVKVLEFVRQAKSLDLSLAEIQEILRLDNEGLPCERVKELLGAHITRLDQTMADLRVLRRRLVDAQSHFATMPASESCICPIIESQAT